MRRYLANPILVDAQVPRRAFALKETVVDYLAYDLLLFPVPFVDILLPRTKVDAAFPLLDSYLPRAKVERRYPANLLLRRGSC
jgi:hypothetical protein